MRKLWILSLLLAVSCSGGQIRRHVYSEPLMFTQFDMVLYSSLPKKQVDAEAAKVWEELHYWFKELSPVGEGAAAVLNETGRLSPEDNPKAFAVLSNFVARSKDINRQSKGAFDLTVYPLVRLWGFYKQDTNRIPSDEEIKDVLKTIGMDKVILDEKGIRLTQGARLDYGAIAKGFAVDVAVAMLTNIEGMHGGFINAGGNLRIFGNKPDQSDWTVGVRDPNGGDVQEAVILFNGESIATSGDYEQYFIAPDGSYYHHIFNPLTGYPARHNLASVSVVVQDGAEAADIFATTFLAMGREAALDLVEKMGLENKIALFFIERNGDELTTHANDVWLKRRKVLEN